MKRILCILSTLSAGGAETFLMKVSRVLPAKDYQFDFIVSVDGGCYTQEVLDRGGKIYKIPLRTRDPIGALNGIRKIVKENAYECVLKLGDTSIASLDLVAAQLGGASCRVMRSCNALTGLSAKENFLHLLLRPLLNAVSTIKLAPSMLAAEFTFGKAVAHNEAKIIHNGVDLNVFHFDQGGRERVRSEFDIADRLVVGHVGRFEEQKNHKFLLEIFRNIREVRNDAVLLLVGTGKLELALREQVKEMNLQNAVIFAGQRFDIPQVLSAMDVFVFPSFHEGMPNTVIEAQATGLPCIIANTITPDANITGLVHYLSLTASGAEWAEKAISMVTQERMDTASSFMEHGYNIDGVAQNLMELLSR